MCHIQIPSALLSSQSCYSVHLLFRVPLVFATHFAYVCLSLTLPSPPLQPASLLLQVYTSLSLSLSFVQSVFLPVTRSILSGRHLTPSSFFLFLSAHIASAGEPTWALLYGVSQWLLPATAACQLSCLVCLGFPRIYINLIFLFHPSSVHPADTGAD